SGAATAPMIVLFLAALDPEDIGYDTSKRDCVAFERLRFEISAFGQLGQELANGRLGSGRALRPQALQGCLPAVSQDRQIGVARPDCCCRLDWRLQRELTALAGVLEDHPPVALRAPLKDGVLPVGEVSFGAWRWRCGYTFGYTF